jgi:hypothetical protein
VVLLSRMVNLTICSSLKPQNIGEEHLPISEDNNQQTIQSKCSQYQEGDLQGKVDLKENKAILIHEITNAADAPVLQAKDQRTRLGTHLSNNSILINKESLELSSPDVSHSIETNVTHEAHEFLNPNLVGIFNECKCCIISKSHLKYCQDCRIDHSNNQLSDAQKIERYWIRKDNEALNGCQICPLSQWVKDIEEKLRIPKTRENGCMDEEAWSLFLNLAWRSFGENGGYPRRLFCEMISPGMKFNSGIGFGLFCILKVLLA